MSRIDIKYYFVTLLFITSVKSSYSQKVEFI